MTYQLTTSDTSSASPTTPSSPMTYTYTWTNAEQSSLKREDEQGNIAFVPVAEGNRDYAEFLASGAEAAPYVAPPEPEPLTAEEKLANSGLTVDELKTLLGI